MCVCVCVLSGGCPHPIEPVQNRKRGGPVVPFLARILGATIIGYSVFRNKAFTDFRYLEHVRAKQNQKTLRRKKHRDNRRKESALKPPIRQPVRSAFRGSSAGSRCMDSGLGSPLLCWGAFSGLGILSNSAACASATVGCRTCLSVHSATVRRQAVLPQHTCARIALKT